MRIFTKIGNSRVGLSIKALAGKVRFPGRAFLFWNLNRLTDAELSEKVGDGTSSDVLMTPIRWLQRAIVEAPIVSLDPKGEPLEGNGLTELLKKPNPFYSTKVLLQGTAFGLSTDGNAYWLAALNTDGLPVELWSIPHTNMTPRWPDDDNSKFITYYEYNVSGQTQKIAPMGIDKEDVDSGVEEGLAVIHFREGLDPTNLRKGLAPIKGLLLEIWTDNEAASYTAALLKNNAVPGVVISPKGEGFSLTPDEAKAAKAHAQEHFTGAKRGEPLVNLGPTDVHQFGFSPQQLDLSVLRDVSEERVTAALGIPAAVVGFGSGLQATKVGATMKEMRQMAWFNAVIPLQQIIAGEVSRALGPSFDVDSVEFDNKGVQALRENEDTKAARIGRLYRDGVLMRSESRTALGFESVPADEVYLANLSNVFIPQGQAALLDDPETRSAGNGNGASDRKAHAEIHQAFTKAFDNILESGRPLDVVPAYWLNIKEHSAAERRIVAAAPRAKPTRAAALLARQIDLIRRRSPAGMEDDLEAVFTMLGEDVARVADEVLVDFELTGDPERRALAQIAELKQGELLPGDAALAAQIAGAVDTATAQAEFQAAFEAAYLQVATEVGEAVADQFAIGFVIDDAMQQAVLQEGGLRAGLVDLSAQTTDAIFDALAEGRAQGMTAENLARFIRSEVEAGPWSSATVRARMIARTEGAHAANTSTLTAARSMPETEHVQVFDNRSGFGDEDCVAADGVVVTINEAEAMGLAHPNCTRSFVPINALLMEEMGL